jgi:hypothetical protein
MTTLMYSFIYVRKNREVCIYKYSHNQIHPLTREGKRRGRNRGEMFGGYEG